MESTQEHIFEKQLEPIFEEFTTVTEAMLDMTREGFLACITAMMEEYCEINDEDFTELIGKMEAFNAVKRAGLEPFAIRMGELMYVRESD